MIVGKHINRYYLKYGWLLVLGLAALITVDYLQLEVPRIYQLIINGVSTGQVELDGVMHTFDLNILLDHICIPMVSIILAVVFGRFAWRACFFGKVKSSSGIGIDVCSASISFSPGISSTPVPRQNSSEAVTVETVSPRKFAIDFSSANLPLPKAKSTRRSFCEAFVI